MTSHSVVKAIHCKYKQFQSSAAKSQSHWFTRFGEGREVG